jgi:diguanylate cyclase (GGDEF)-like protein
MLIGLQNIVLKMIAQGDDLQSTLMQLCLEVERLLPGTRASILTMDDQRLLHPCVSPSLPEAYSAALDDLSIGPEVGSCGSAAYLQTAVVVTDIAHDPRWAAFKDLALPLGLAACFSSPIFSSKGRVLGTFALYFDVARAPTPLEQSIVQGCVPLAMIALERHERVMERHRLAYTDVLTSLPNRARFNEVLAGEVKASCTLMLIDVDNLKTVNDTFGHVAGDELIVAVASNLAATVAPSPAYRLGGDEFAVILIGRDEVTSVAQAVLDNLCRPVICDGHTVHTSVTIGIASADLQSQSLAELRQNADMALYHAKEKHRGHFLAHDSALTTSISRRNQAIQDVASALKDGRIEAWYQPVIRLDTGEIVGVEALARMHEPDGRVLPAAAFHEATKDVFVAAALTHRMIECIARDLRHWLDLGIPFQHVGINLSAADFNSSDFPQSLESAFKEQNVPLHHAVLEVTESVYLGERDQRVARKIQSLRAAGFKIALDDFGTGFASLTHLVSVPVDIIKIDRSFVERLGPGDVGTSIIEGILHIARGLNIRVVAEGIETVDQARSLSERGCLLGQGYLYSKAVPAGAMAQLLFSRAQPSLGNERERNRHAR